MILLKKFSLTYTDVLIQILGLNQKQKTGSHRESLRDMHNGNFYQKSRLFSLLLVPGLMNMAMCIIPQFVCGAS